MFVDNRIRKVVVVQKFRNQPAYEELLSYFGPKIITFTQEFDENTISVENLGPASNGSAIVVLDDMMHLVANSELLCSLIIGGVHHNNITVFLVGHNLYGSRSATWLTISRNLTMLCIMPNPRDMSILSTLNRQLFPGKGKNLVSTAFKYAAQDNLRYNNTNYSYLLIDCATTCPDRFRLRTGIGDDVKFCYAIDG